MAFYKPHPTHETGCPTIIKAITVHLNPSTQGAPYLENLMDFHSKMGVLHLFFIIQDS